MKILVVQSHAQSHAGYIALAADAAGAVLDARTPPDGDVLPASDSDHDGLLMLGGPMGACDDAEYPHLLQTVELIHQFHGHEKPILGVCLGAQLIARANGKQVYHHRRPEVGYYPIHFTPEARHDPLLANAPEEIFLMQFRQDTFDLPGGAVHLMTDDINTNQGFRLGRTTYGIQPHFEVEPEFSRRWIAIDPAVTERYRPGLAGIFEDQLAAYDSAARAFCLALSNAWLALMRDRLDHA